MRKLQGLVVSNEKSGKKNILMTYQILCKHTEFVDDGMAAQMIQVLSYMIKEAANVTFRLAFMDWIFRSVVAKLAQVLEGQDEGKWQGTAYVCIDGSTDAHDRRSACQRFRDDPSIRVALLSVTAAGE